MTLRDKLDPVAYCQCCSKSIFKIEDMDVRDYYEGRLDGYCYTCASTRCDAYPAACRE